MYNSTNVNGKVLLVFLVATLCSVVVTYQPQNYQDYSFDQGGGEGQRNLNQDLPQGIASFQQAGGNQWQEQPTLNKPQHQAARTFVDPLTERQPPQSWGEQPSWVKSHQDRSSFQDPFEKKTSSPQYRSGVDTSSIRANFKDPLVEKSNQGLPQYKKDLQYGVDNSSIRANFQDPLVGKGNQVQPQQASWMNEWNNRKATESNTIIPKYQANIKEYQIKAPKTGQSYQQYDSSYNFNQNQAGDQPEGYYESYNEASSGGQYEDTYTQGDGETECVCRRLPRQP